MGDLSIAFLPQNGQGKRWMMPFSLPQTCTDSFPEYSRVAQKLLFNRGIKTQKDIDEFFNPDYGTDMHDPYLFADMEKAVKRVLRAISAGEKIVIYGDYDADGVCGSTVLHTALSALGARIEVYIPDRFSEGYGMNEKMATKIAKDKETSMVITVDCGSSDVKEITILYAAGKDTVVVDHHLVPPDPPPAFAMLNPKREGESYPFKYLCATGIAFKFACALLAASVAKTAGVKEGAEKWLLDIAAIGTVADMVPLLGENRTLVKYGLMVIEKTKRQGLKELLSYPPPRMTDSRKKGEVTAHTIGFMIAPRINAASRMAHAALSFELLTTHDAQRARVLGEKLEELNNERRRVVDAIMKEAESASNGEQVLVAGRSEWPVGVVGLVAGRLTEKFGKPSFVYGGVNGAYRGSCRGIGDFNVVDAMRFCEEKEPGLLTAFGGHAMAGGFTLSPEKLNRFAKLLIKYGKEKLDKDALHPALVVDAQVDPEDINWELHDALARFEPHGEGNKRPAFLFAGATVVSARGVGQKEDHLKMKLKAITKDGAVKFFDCIGFGLFSRLRDCQKGDKVDVLFELETNEYNGTRELQLKLKDIRYSEARLPK